MRPAQHSARKRPVQYRTVQDKEPKMSPSIPTKYAVVVEEENKTYVFSESITDIEAKGIAYGLYISSPEKVRIIVYSVCEGRKKRLIAFGGEHVNRDELTYANIHQPSHDILSLFTIS